jgi:hypothetical protein
LVGVYSRYVAAGTLALSPIRDSFCEGFSQFVTSLAAPAEAVAGWDFHPLESTAIARRTPGVSIGEMRLRERRVDQDVSN